MFSIMENLYRDTKAEIEGKCINYREEGNMRSHESYEVLKVDIESKTINLELWNGDERLDGVVMSMPLDVFLKGDYEVIGEEGETEGDPGWTEYKRECRAENGEIQCEGVDGKSLTVKDVIWVDGWYEIVDLCRSQGRMTIHLENDRQFQVDEVGSVSIKRIR